MSDNPGSGDSESFVRAGILLVIGSGLYLITWFAHGRHQPVVQREQALVTREMAHSNPLRASTAAR